MEAGSWARRDETVVADPAWAFALMWVAFPVLGAGAGWLLKMAVEWAATLPWAPLKGPFKLVASIPEPYATVGALAIGALAGLVLAYLAVADALAVTVTDDRVTLVRGGQSQVVDRGAVSGAFLDGKKLVLLGSAGQELAREDSDLSADRLRDAFLAHRYPWLPDGDPYSDEFRRWVEDTPDLPGGANALLKARAKALHKGDSDDARELRQELARLGVVVREEKKKQYWRRSGQAPEITRDGG